MWRLHRWIWDLSGGRLGRTIGGIPVLELVTTGHRSGLPRAILIYYFGSDERPLIAGSNAGLDRDPAWVVNLRSNPSARVRIDGKWRDVSARFLQGDEYGAAWSDLGAATKEYAEYQRMMSRQIPLVALERPITGNGS